MQGNNNFRYMIRILAGIYLLYLSWNLVTGLRSGETSGIVFIIAIAVFVVAGVFFILDALRHMRQETLNNQTGNTADENTENEADVPSVPEENPSENDSDDRQDSGD
ncbi:MAG TPA: hypothetical protein DF613_08645 [Lachnospiraceae bacterium]|nr:hypothetical protein [Lachnospiraceae bacterium]